MTTIGYCRLSIVAASLALASLAGCTPDEHHREIPPAAAGKVSAYGLTLDENASPQQVAFVFLKSVADDVRAAQAKETAAQKDAMKLTHSILAYSTIEQRLLNADAMIRGQNKTTLGAEREEKLWDFARNLAPIISHYVASFPATWEEAAPRLRFIPVPGDKSGRVIFEAAHDPNATDTKEKDPVNIDIEVVKEPAGAVSYWRVAKVAFAGRPGAPRPPRAVSQPATATAAP